MRKLLRGAHRKLRDVSSGSGTGGNAGNSSDINPTDGEVFTVIRIARHTVKRNAELSNQNGSNQDGTEENRLSVMESNSQVKLLYPTVRICRKSILTRIVYILRSRPFAQKQKVVIDPVPVTSCGISVEMKVSD